MYQGKNPKALTSKKCLLEALRGLLEEKEFKNITVSEICSRSGVSRQTFYSLFETKENLLRCHLDQISDRETGHTNTENINDEVMELSDICRRYSEYVISSYGQLRMLIRNNIEEVLFSQFYQAMSSCRRGFLEMPEEEREYAALFMSAGLCCITQKYVCTHEEPDREELIHLSYKLMSGSVYRR